MPGQNVGLDVGQSQVNPAWYGYLSGLKKLYDYVKLLQPLSDLPAHDDTKSNVIRSINWQAGAAYTIELTDAGNIIAFTSASAVSVSIPLNSSIAFPSGTQIDLIQIGAGKVTFGGSGITINSIAGYKSLAAPHAWCSLLKVATNTWQLGGTLSA